MVTGQPCRLCGEPNPSKFFIGLWVCRACKTEQDAAATKDWCPATGRRVHRYSDWGSWVEHRHPQCDMCNFIDTSRTI